LTSSAQAPALPARAFVVLGTTALASGAFSIDDIPSTGGRIDVLLRCVRAALLCSHGVRRDAAVLLVLQGGEGAPRTLRIDGATARFVRPDERSLAALVKKSLQSPERAARNGVLVRDGGLEVALDWLGPRGLFVLDEGAPDLRATPLPEGPRAFVVGDHRGFDEPARALLAARGAIPVGLGPVSMHAEDAVSVVSNELDRRDTPR
jgi:tRNA (pseudouridine54-N1)-methyltransferase